MELELELEHDDDLGSCITKPKPTRHSTETRNEDEGASVYNFASPIKNKSLFYSDHDTFRSGAPCPASIILSKISSFASRLYV